MESSRDNVIRKRVLQACNRCHLRKLKCDGSSPCGHCKAKNVICVFGERKTNKVRSDHKACNRCRLIKLKCDGSSPCGHCKAKYAICVFGECKKYHYNSKTAVAPGLNDAKEKTPEGFRMTRHGLRHPCEGCKERQVDSCPSVSQYCVLLTGWCDLMFLRGCFEKISNQLITTTVIQLSERLMVFESLDMKTCLEVYCFSEQYVLSRDALTDAGREELWNMFVGAAEQRANLTAHAATTPRPIDYAYTTSVGQNSEPGPESSTCVSQSRRERLPSSDPCLTPVGQSSCAVAVEDRTVGTTLMEDDQFFLIKDFYPEKAALTEEASH